MDHAFDILSEEKRDAEEAMARTKEMAETLQSQLVDKRTTVEALSDNLKRSVKDSSHEVLKLQEVVRKVQQDAKEVSKYFSV